MVSHRDAAHPFTRIVLAGVLGVMVTMTATLLAGGGSELATILAMIVGFILVLATLLWTERDALRRRVPLGARR